jgi:choline monooxygenase
MDDVENFCQDDYGLRPIRVETWEGFVFINFDRAAPGLRDWLGDLPERVQNSKLHEMRLTRRVAYEVKCNWKVYFENTHEGYHVATVHAKHVDPAHPDLFFPEEPGGPYELLRCPDSVINYGGFPAIDGLSEEERRTTSFVLVHPNLCLILAPTYMKFRQFLPEGPENLRLIHNWCFPRTTVERGDFLERVAPEYYARFDELVEEDMRISPIVQRGLRSRLYSPGRFSTQEVLVHGFANYVLDRVLGPDAAECGTETVARGGRKEDAPPLS